jgi:hypothetical protein
MMQLVTQLLAQTAQARTLDKVIVWNIEELGYGG